MRIYLLLVTAVTLGAQENTQQYVFGTTVVSTSGLHGRICNLKEHTPNLPRLDRMQEVGSIYTNSLNVWPQEFSIGFPGITERFEWFGIEYKGRFWVDQPGEYRFSLLSDDGAALVIDDKEVIDNDGTHMPQAQSGSAVLSRGVHTIEVSYFQGPRFTVALVLAIAAPGKPWRIFNTDDYLPPKDPAEWVKGKISQIKQPRPMGRR